MARQVGGRGSGSFRFKLGLGVLALGAFLIALPAAALACVTPGQCTAGGGIPNSPPGNCGGGSQGGQPICGTLPQPQLNSRRFTKALTFFGLPIVELQGRRSYDPGDPPQLPQDPFVDFTSIRDNGAQVVNSNGAFSSAIPSSKTSDVGGGAGTALNLSKQFDLDANHSVWVHGIFQYDSLDTTYDPSGRAPVLGPAGSARYDLYTLNGTFNYRAYDSYFGLGAGGDLGHANATDNGAAAVGSFGIHGYQAQLFAGHVFTLFDSTGGAHSSSPPSKAASTVSTTSDGYSVHLVLSGYTGYRSFSADDFTDSTGLAWGTARAHSWAVGGTARLYYRVVDGRLTWRPFVSATVQGELDYSGKMDIPAQGAQAADTLYFGSPQTFWGIGTGFDVLDVSGWDFGLQGLYQQSAQYQSVGGQLFLRYYVQQPR